MKRRITTTALRERFEKAWSAVPAPEQKSLRPFIRYVDEVPVLKGTFVYGRPRGGTAIESMAGPLERGVGHTAFLSLASGNVVDVILSADPLASCDEDAALAVILHELAHAWDYLRETISERSVDGMERYARALAQDWASKASLPDELKDNVKQRAGSYILKATGLWTNC